MTSCARILSRRAATSNANTISQWATPSDVQAYTEGKGDLIAELDALTARWMRA